MAVYTEVSVAQVTALFAELEIGRVTDLQGITGGIENTNYFVTSEQQGRSQRHVLTLFERLSFEQLPFYLRLMKHLADKALPVPDPVAGRDGELVQRVNGKPAAVVTMLPGRSELAPTAVHCAELGATLARMHLAGRDFALVQPNLRGLNWWVQTAPVVLPHLDASQSALLQTELAYQRQVAASKAYRALPQGPIHADLFRDNVVFDTVAGRVRLCGLFDFYFAGVDTWLFDLAVCLNDWCMDASNALPDARRTASLLSAYESVRPLGDVEREMLPAMLRAAALRFWLSRLWDHYLPRQAALLQAHDPSHFERVLRQRRAQAGDLQVSLACDDLESCDFQGH